MKYVLFDCNGVVLNIYDSMVEAYEGLMAFQELIGGSMNIKQVKIK